MANAAAKKAAAAKQQATSTYAPFLLCANILHSILTYRKGISTFRSIMTVLQWIITYVSYQGILTSSSSSSSSSNANSKNLKGGAWLDLLGLVILTQYGALFMGSISALFDGLLFVVPGMYMLYKKFGPSGNDNDDGDGNGKNKKLTKEEQLAKEQLEERRKKRAERRRQKRA